MDSNLTVRFRLDDLSGEATRALVARHLAGMYASSPPESVHALGIEHLRAPDIAFWSAWVDEEIAGCGALKRLDALRERTRPYTRVRRYLLHSRRTFLSL